MVGCVLFVGGVGTANNDGEARTVIKLWVYAASCLLAPTAKDTSKLPRDLVNKYQIPRLEWTISEPPAALQCFIRPKAVLCPIGGIVPDLVTNSE